MSRKYKIMVDSELQVGPPLHVHYFEMHTVA